MRTIALTLMITIGLMLIDSSSAGVVRVPRKQPVTEVQSQVVRVEAAASGVAGDSAVTSTASEPETVSIAGRVYYYSNATVGIAGATLENNLGVVTTCSSSGCYMFSDVPAGSDMTICPQRSDCPISPLDITPSDSRLLAKAVVNQIVLDANQQLAGKVTTTDGAPNIMDARQVMRYCVGYEKLPFLPDAWWRFNACHRAYTDLRADLIQQDFQAIVVGDVDGSWARNHATGPDPAARAMLDGFDASTGKITPALRSFWESGQ